VLTNCDDLFRERRFDSPVRFRTYNPVVNSSQSRPRKGPFPGLFRGAILKSDLWPSSLSCYERIDLPDRSQFACDAFKLELLFEPNIFAPDLGIKEAVVSWLNLSMSALSYFRGETVCLRGAGLLLLTTSRMLTPKQIPVRTLARVS
jgi:hypothetical protein